MLWLTISDARTIKAAFSSIDRTMRGFGIFLTDLDMGHDQDRDLGPCPIIDLDHDHEPAPRV